MTRLPVRDDLKALEGYHSPQVDVRVRLNTNEAPVGPPAEFEHALARAVSDVDWNRYPDRAATDLRREVGNRMLRYGLAKTQGEHLKLLAPIYRYLDALLAVEHLALSEETPADE